MEIILSFIYVLLILFDKAALSVKGTIHGYLLDHHFNRIDSQAELLALGYGICDSAAAVGHLCVKVHPAARLRLCHQQDVHLKGAGWVGVRRRLVQVFDTQTYIL